MMEDYKTDFDHPDKEEPGIVDWFIGWMIAILLFVLIIIGFLWVIKLIGGNPLSEVLKYQWEWIKSIRF